MALLRAEAERFCQRRVPIKFAWALNRAAALVTVGRGRRGGECRGVKKHERRSATNSLVGIADLVGAERKARARSIVSCQTAEVGCHGRSGLPRHDILETPIAERVH